MWRTVTFGMFAMRGAAGVGRTVATAAMEGQPAAQRMIDALPSQMRLPTEPGQGSLAGRVVFGRSGFTEDAKAGLGKQASGEGNAGSAGGESTEARGSQIKQEMRLPGVAPASYDGERIDRAGEEMYDQAGSSPSSAAAVSAAMAQFPPETQRAIADFRANDEQKLRDLMAHNLDSPSLTSEQRQALWTIGSARNRGAQQGIDAAMNNLDESQTGTTPPSAAQGPPRASEPQTASGGQASHPGGEASRPGAAANGTPSPALPAQRAPASEGATSRTTPLTGPPAESEQDGRSLGADLPQQPPSSGESGNAGGTSPNPGLSDIEPFLD